MDHHRVFSDNSDLYARIRPRYPSGIYEFIARATPQHVVAWDCACGNGQVAVDLKRFFDQVEATDISEEQISHTMAVEGVRFSVQAAESTDFDNQAFDTICVGQALHWFDYEKFWPEVDRLLKPNGVFVAWGYIFPNMNPAIDNVLNDTLYPVIAPFWSERNRLLWNHYRDVQIPYHRLDVPQFKFVIDWNLEELLAYICTWSAVQRCMDALGDAFYTETCHKVSELWGDKATRQRIEMGFCFIATQKKT